MDKILAGQPLTVPMMLVHSLWDQEDIYGAPAVYKALKAKAGDKLFMVMGPWHHGQEIRDGSSLGSIKFGSDTSAYFRRQILRQFLDHYLKDGAPPMDVSPVNAFETGTNTWRRLQTWPAGCASGCNIKPTPMYLKAGLKMNSAAPSAAMQLTTNIFPTRQNLSRSVPARTVRPAIPKNYHGGDGWSTTSAKLRVAPTC